MKIKVALTEDNVVFRRNFLAIMKHQHSLEFVVEAENGVDLLGKLDVASPEIILLDIKMPVMDGFATARLVSARFPLIKIVAFTQFDEDENIIEMNRIGVNNFIGKDQIDDVPRILQIIHSGGIYFPQKVAKVLKEYLNRVPANRKKCPYLLNDLEITLIRSIGLGLNRTQIGELINKSPRTVEKYRADLYLKFNVKNQQQLILEASKWSLLV